MIVCATSMDELTPEQEQVLLEDLIALQAELEAYMEISRAGTEAVDLDQPIGRVSRNDALQQQQMAKATRARNATRMRQVAAALSKARDGEYGYCRKCDEPVGYGRLKARPETPFCVDCQGRFEAG